LALDRFALGRETITATRFLIEPRVPGLTGVAATVAGNQPDALRMWIADGRAPTLVHFEGGLYSDGPVWRVDLHRPTPGPVAVVDPGLVPERV
jgi:hypothetical protein